MGRRCMAYQIWKNEASYELTSVFLLHLKFMRPLKKKKIEEALNSGKR